MNSQRGALSKRDALRKQEEIMDLKLKEIGCWEAGLSMSEKNRIIEFLKESEVPSSQEGPRQNKTLSGGAGCRIVDTEILLSERNECSEFQKDDSPEPMIMYESFTSKSADKVSESSSDELTLFPHVKKSNSLLASNASCSSADKNNISHSKRSLNFGNVDKRTEKLDVSITSTTKSDSESASSGVNNSDSCHNTALLNSQDFATDSLPLKGSVMLSENPQKVYFKNSSETREQCVDRLLSMISNFHHNLTIFQSTLTDHIPWGSPMPVGPARQYPYLPTTSGVSGRQLRSTNTHQSNDNYNVSGTESSSEESNTKVDDWINCSKKKLVKRKKRTSQLPSPGQLTEGSKYSNGKPTAKIPGGSSISRNVTEKNMENGTATTFRSIKRKTFSLSRNINSDEAPSKEMEQPALKKLKVNPQNENSTQSLSDTEDIVICPSPIVKRGRQYVRKLQPLQYVDTSKPIEDDDNIPSSSTHQEGINSIRSVSPVAEKSPEKSELVSCPLCQKEFPVVRIEAHAWDCMVDGDIPNSSPIRRSSEDDIICLERQAGL